MSEGGTYAHNLLTGKIDNWYDMGRLTPHLQPHETAVAGLTITQGGDNRYFNNIFIGQGLPGDAPVAAAGPKKSITGFGLWVYDARNSAPQTGGNVYLYGARPYSKELAPLTLAEVDPAVKLVEKAGGWYLEMTSDKAWNGGAKRELVTTALLGMTAISKLPFENPDGSPVKIDGDYFGKPRESATLTSGPFAHAGTGLLSIKVR